jgi:crotonobetainyl-CoA:carnitine CoA-transferase CaiB-like acyl-CoA transferase
MTVLDFSQFLAGPIAALRLADLGARVIKIERPGVGELGRKLAVAGLEHDGDTVSFQAMNRNKQSVAADLKDGEDLEFVKRLVARSDVLIENFRPGVMERLGLDYESVRETNPGLVYGSVSGYGTTGPWKDRPGQDLLAQAVSGLPWLNGTAEDPPIPVGISVADHLASSQLALGITSLLVRRERTGLGGRVETSLLEVALDLQFELLTAYFADRDVPTGRGGRYSGHPLLGAPYGIYPTSDGYIAIAMNPVPAIGRLVGLSDLEAYEDPASWVSAQDEIRAKLAAHLSGGTTRHWLDLLDPADIWCAEVLTLRALAESEGFASINMMQETSRPGRAGELASGPLKMTRLPFRIDGEVVSSPAGAPRIGEHTELVRAELLAEIAKES